MRARRARTVPGNRYDYRGQARPGRYWPATQEHRAGCALRKLTRNQPPRWTGLHTPRRPPATGQTAAAHPRHAPTAQQPGSGRPEPPIPHSVRCGSLFDLNIPNGGLARGYQGLPAPVAVRPKYAPKLILASSQVAGVCWRHPDLVIARRPAASLFTTPFGLIRRIHGRYDQPTSSPMFTVRDSKLCRRLRQAAKSGLGRVPRLTFWVAKYPPNWLADRRAWLSWLPRPERDGLRDLAAPRWVRLLRVGLTIQDRRAGGAFRHSSAAGPARRSAASRPGCGTGHL